MQSAVMNGFQPPVTYARAAVSNLAPAAAVVNVASEPRGAVYGERRIVAPGFDLLDVTLGKNYTHLVGNDKLGWTNFQKNGRLCYFLLPAITICNYGTWPNHKYSISTRDDAARLLRARLAMVFANNKENFPTGDLVEPKSPDYVNFTVCPSYADPTVLSVGYRNEDKVKAAEFTVKDLRALKGNTYNLFVRAALLTTTDGNHDIKFYVGTIEKC